MDLFITNSRSANYLYQNVGGSFTKVLSGAAIAPSTRSLAADFADVDNDGDLDLFTANKLDPIAGASTLLLSQTEGAYTSYVSGAVIEGAFASADVAWADVDGDGDLDLFVANTGGANELFVNVSADHPGCTRSMRASPVLCCFVPVRLT